jgi:hypothetical protein
MIELPARPRDAGVTLPRDAGTVRIVRTVPPKARGAAVAVPPPSIDAGVTVAGPLVEAPPQEMPVIDASVDVPVHPLTPVLRPNKPEVLDRNQTLNPFTRKRTIR